MGIGYVTGCFISILLWNIDRRRLFLRLNNLAERFIRKYVAIEVFYVLIIAFAFYVFSMAKNSEVMNAVTAFIAIDMSNTEKRNLNIGERTHFYDSISLISKALVGGFAAPLFYIVLLGNGMCIAYAIIFNIVFLNRYHFFKIIFNILNIIPAFVIQILLYIVYITRNKKFSIDFKGDYFINCITRPLLNIDIFGAYIEAVNFYYYFNHSEVHYVKSYGEYANRINITCIKDYLSIAYGVAMVYFVIFFLIQRII